MKTNNFLSFISSVLVAGLALAAFVLSYDALRDLAANSGAVRPGLAWLFPVVVDGDIIVFSLSVLRNSLLGEGARGRMFLIIAFTALSIALNVMHATPERIISEVTLARIIAGVIPLCILLSFETLMGQVKSWALRNKAVLALAELQAQIKRAKIEARQCEKAASQAKLSQASLNTTQDELKTAERLANQATAELKLVEEHLTKAEAELTQVNAGVKAGNQQIKEIEARLKIAEGMFSGESLAERILGTHAAFPTLNQAAIKVITGASAGHVSKVLQNGEVK